MTNPFVFGLLVAIIFFFGPAASDLTPPREKVTKAYELLEKWNAWHGVTDFKDDLDWKKQLKTTVVGSPCEESAAETAQRAYYLRIAMSIKSGSARPQSLYRWAAVIANSMNHYEQMLANVPSRPNKDFCGFEVNTDFDVSPDADGFLWPPNPSLLVCKPVSLNSDEKKCARCGDIDQNQEKSLWDACHLKSIEESKDKRSATGEGQIHFESIKAKLQKILDKGLAKEHGDSCRATEEQTGKFVEMWTLTRTSAGTEPQSKEELDKEWEGIKKVEDNLQYYKDLLNSLTDEDIETLTFCDPSYKKGVRKIGEDSLVCGGETCKNCRDNPPRRDGQPDGVFVTMQTWRYEYGPLLKACSSINGELRELEKQGGECPKKPVCTTPRPKTREECEAENAAKEAAGSGRTGMESGDNSTKVEGKKTGGKSSSGEISTRIDGVELELLALLLALGIVSRVFQ